MGNPIQWGRTHLDWTPDGYRLVLTILLDERAAALFESRLAGVLESFEALLDDDLLYDFASGAVENFPRVGFNTQHATLAIIAGRSLFAVDADRFRRELTDLAVSCRREAEEQQQRDEEIAEGWLAKLRAP